MHANVHACAYVCVSVSLSVCLKSAYESVAVVFPREDRIRGGNPLVCSFPDFGPHDEISNLQYSNNSLLLSIQAFHYSINHQYSPSATRYISFSSSLLPM